jgi:hypothetical protein
MLSHFDGHAAALPVMLLLPDIMRSWCRAWTLT